MSPTAGRTCLVLPVFALIFTKRWLKLWQRQWEQPKPSQAAGSRVKGAKKKKSEKSSPARFYERIFSLHVTLWFLIYQRLNFDSTQAAVMRNLRDGGADRLGRRGGKLSKRIRSADTSAYNQARQRMPLELLEGALNHLREVLLNLVSSKPTPTSKPGPSERTRQLVDGSTLSMLATPELVKAFPPARNQNGASDWCLMRIVVGFCTRSGAILSAIQGAVQMSEQTLCWTLIEQAARFTIWIGDRNFGVWSVVAQAVRYEQDVLVRLTRTRAAKHCQGRAMSSGQERLIQWEPSRGDQAAPGTPRSAVAGRLIYVRLKKAGRWIDLWLFTTLEAQDYPVELLVQWYGQRWQAELHFRSVKTQMKMSELDVCSPQMARKEFYSGLLAYSLVRVVMWKAGERLEGGIKAISFSQARRVLLDHLQKWGRGLERAAKTLQSWSRSLLAEVAKQILPKRRKQRPSEVRRVRHRRQKFPAFKGSRAAARARFLHPKSL